MAKPCGLPPKAVLKCEMLKLVCCLFSYNCCERARRFIVLCCFVAAVVKELGKGSMSTAMILTDNNVWVARATSGPDVGVIPIDIYDATTCVVFHTLELNDCGANATVTQLIKW